MRISAKNSSASIHSTAHLEAAAFELPIWLGPGVRLGPNVAAGRYVLINQDSEFSHGTIGSFCSIGKRCTLNARNHPQDWLTTHGLAFHRGVPFRKEFADIDIIVFPIAPVHIGNDVWIGNHVNIVGGVTIGDGVIIGAGSVVTKDIPPYAVVCGSPATVHRFRFNDEIIARLLRLKWWDLELSELNLPFNNIELCLDILEEREINWRRTETRRQQTSSSSS